MKAGMTMKGTTNSAGLIVLRLPAALAGRGARP